MEDYKKILQIEVHNIVDRLQNGLIHPYTAKQEIFKSTLKAINYTHSCTELKEKKAPTFDEWLKKLKWKQLGSSYTFKRGESYTDAESLLISYKKEYYNL